VTQPAEEVGAVTEPTEISHRELERMLREAPQSHMTLWLGSQLGRDLAREFVEACRAYLEVLLRVRCGDKRHLLASVWPTLWGPWVECAGLEPTPAGWRDIAAPRADLAEIASGVTKVGRYPDESGLLRPGPSLLHQDISRMTPLERANWDSLSVGHLNSVGLRQTACHCAAWQFTDNELSAAMEARRKTVELTGDHRMKPLR
jgi:hypothetical protein